MDGGLAVKEGQHCAVLMSPDSGAKLPGFIFWLSLLPAL